MSTPSTIQPATDAASHLDLAITLTLNNWPALSLAVQSNWGGPNSSEKRDWLCGAISDMLADRPETDAVDLEEVLIQVMNDEFDVAVDDESAADVADLIMELKAQTDRGEFGTIQQMLEKFQKKSQNRSAVGQFQRVEAADEDQETDESEEGDVEMGDAPNLVRAPRERAEPEVDDDGFTKVVGKKRKTLDRYPFLVTCYDAYITKN
ncbi:Pc12g10170 [Penicillium rubens Wisconsin 54-1255]|uniref:Pc12g10170 protein n=2 Tax=Penicillium chrysogenum species complex TaxID=254878 RepID=B6H088_PENRW|nr:Pc12g10170 [Penicillium rubens Wisconsin 54-1255]